MSGKHLRQGRLGSVRACDSTDRCWRSVLLDNICTRRSLASSACMEDKHMTALTHREQLPTLVGAKCIDCWQCTSCCSSSMHCSGRDSGREASGGLLFAAFHNHV
jgi:hypothetical protein